MAVTIPVRHLIAFLALGSILNIFIGRLNLAIAIVEMTNTEKRTKEHLTNSDVCFENSKRPVILKDTQNKWILSDTNSPITAHHQNHHLVQTNISQVHQHSIDRKFDWSETMQGHILSSFFYGYLIMQLPAGLLLTRIGPRYICSVGILGTGLLNLLTPTIAGYFWLFIGSRFTMGLLQAGVFSSVFYLVTKWTPDGERSTVLAMTGVGAALGAIISSSMTGYICKHYGWPVVFYVSGIAITLFGLVYFLLVTDHPKDHLLISSKEFNFIQENISGLKSQPVENKARRASFPWKNVLRSKHVWAMISTKYAMILFMNVVIYKTAAYMAEVLLLPIDQIGYYSSVMYLVKGVFYLLGGILADFFIKRRLLRRKTMVRKLFQAIATFGTSALFLLLPFTNCSPKGFLIVLLCSMATYGMTTGGEIPVPTDMSNEHASMLFAIANMICSTSGFAPEIIGPLLDMNPAAPKHTWWTIFAVVAVLNILGGVAFLIWGTAEQQNWGTEPCDDLEKKDVASLEMELHQEKKENLTVNT